MTARHSCRFFLNEGCHIATVPCDCLKTAKWNCMSQGTCMVYGCGCAFFVHKPKYIHVQIYFTIFKPPHRAVPLWHTAFKKYCLTKQHIFLNSCSSLNVEHKLNEEHNLQYVVSVMTVFVIVLPSLVSVVTVLVVSVLDPSEIE